MVAVIGGPRAVALMGGTMSGSGHRRHLKESRLVVNEFSARTGRTWQSSRTYLARLEDDFPLGVRCGIAVAAWEWVGRFTAKTEQVMATVAPPQFELALLASAATAVADAQTQLSYYLIERTQARWAFAARALAFAISRLQRILAAGCALYGTAP